MNTFWKIMVTLVLIAAIVGIGAYAYSAVTLAGTQTLQASAGGSTMPYLRYWHPFAWYGIGSTLSCLIPLFLLFLALGCFRTLFWPRPWGGHHMHHRWWDWRDRDGKDVPPFFDEWHRRVHSTPDWDKAPEEKQK